MEIRFSGEMAVPTPTADVRLAYEDDREIELPRPTVDYDAEWWSLLVTLPPDLEPDRWLELRLGEGLRDAEGRSLKAVTYRFRVSGDASTGGP